MNERQIGTASAMATADVGAALGRVLAGGAVIYLRGDLGAGKTTFVGGVLRACGFSGAVKSPTYTLVEPYALPEFNLYHFDLYRLRNPEELEFLGIRDYYTAGAVLMIEWPERGAGFLPAADIECVFSGSGAAARTLILRAATDTGARLLTAMRD